MSKAVILSIKPEYSSRILDGSKTIELRRSDMGLQPGDLVLVYESAPKQVLSFWFTIDHIDKLTVDEMWARNSERLGIDENSYREYFLDANEAFGLHIGEIRLIEKPLVLLELTSVIDGFVPPQGIMLIRDRHGRFSRLLQLLNPPLPDSVFPQTSLFD